LILITAFQCISAFSLMVIAYCMLNLSKQLPDLQLWTCQMPKQKVKKASGSVAWKTVEKKHRAKVYEE